MYDITDLPKFEGGGGGGGMPLPLAPPVPASLTSVSPPPHAHSYPPYTLWTKNGELGQMSWLTKMFSFQMTFNL